MEVHDITLLAYTVSRRTVNDFQGTGSLSLFSMNLRHLLSNNKFKVVRLNVVALFV